MNYSWIALILSIIATLPQMYQTVSTGSVKDHNEWSPIIAIAANFFLGLQGYLRKDVGLMILGGWFIVYNGLLTYYKRLAPPEGHTD